MRIARLSATCMLVTVSSAYAQTTHAPDSVTAIVVKSSRIGLSSTANPGPVYLADGTYTSDRGVNIVIVDGRITLVQHSPTSVTEIASARLSNNRIMLTPSTRGALMQVSAFPLPSGTFRGKDGAFWFKVLSGRVTEFTLPAQSP